MLSCVPLEASDWPKYDALVQRSPHGSLFSLSTWEADQVWGVFRGKEIVSGCAFRTHEKAMARYVEATPWQGICARSTDEGENLAAAESLINELSRQFTEVTFTLPPMWADVRPFTWAGMRLHIRYTYRGYGRYEKRVRVPDRPDGNSFIGLLEDWACVYYWRANEGGEHTYWLHQAIEYAKARGKDFDMVGCNSPQRALFKRGFGGRLTPYYAATSSEARDLRSMPVSASRSHEEMVLTLPQTNRGGEPEGIVAPTSDSCLPWLRSHALI